MTTTAPSRSTPHPVASHRPTFGDALRSEALRLLSLRSTWVYVILLSGSVYGPAVLDVVLAPRTQWMEQTPETITRYIVVTGLVAMIFSSVSATSESAQRRTFFARVSRPDRWMTPVVRTLLVVLIVAASALVGFAVAALFAAATSGLSIQMHVADSSAMNPNLVVAMRVVTLLSQTIIAAGVGMLLRNTYISLGLLLGWFLIIESIIDFSTVDFFVALRAYLPQAAMLRLDSGLFLDEISFGHAGIVVAAWVVGLFAAGLAAESRRSVF